jgi:hypothetical protein
MSPTNQTRDAVKSQVRSDSAAAARRQLTRARALLDRFGHLMPDGWKSLAMQLDTDQIAQLDDWQLNGSQLVDPEHAQQLTPHDAQTAAQMMMRKTETTGAILLSDLSQRVAQQVAVLVEQSIGRETTAQRELIDAYERKFQQQTARIVELESQVCEAQEAARQGERASAQIAELELRYSELKIVVGQRDADIVQLKADVETALATAQEQTEKANQIKVLARQLAQLG